MVLLSVRRCFAWLIIFLFSVIGIPKKLLVPIWEIIRVRLSPAYAWSFFNPKYTDCYTTLGSVSRWYICVISKLSRWRWLSYIIKYALWLTVGVEYEHKFPFLNLLVRRTEYNFEYCVYRKPVNKNALLHFFASHDIKTKNQFCRIMLASFTSF